VTGHERLANNTIEPTAGGAGRDRGPRRGPARGVQGKISPGKDHGSASPTPPARSASARTSPQAGRRAVPLRRPCPALRLRAGPRPTTHTPGTQSRAPTGRVRRSTHPEPDRHQPTAAATRQPPCPATVHRLATAQCTPEHRSPTRTSRASGQPRSSVASGWSVRSSPAFAAATIFSRRAPRIVGALLDLVRC
jgi:hypothetical protein